MNAPWPGEPSSKSTRQPQFQPSSLTEYAKVMSKISAHQPLFRLSSPRCNACSRGHVVLSPPEAGPVRLSGS